MVAAARRNFDVSILVNCIVFGFLLEEFQLLGSVEFKERNVIANHICMTLTKLV